MFLRLPRTRPLSGLGQFDEDSLAMKQAELERLRAERMDVEAQVEYLKTGRLPPSASPPAATSQLVSVTRPASVEFFPGSLKVAALLGMGAAAWFVFRRKS